MRTCIRFQAKKLLALQVEVAGKTGHFLLIRGAKGNKRCPLLGEVKNGASSSSQGLVEWVGRTTISLTP